MTDLDCRRIVENSKCYLNLKVQPFDGELIIMKTQNVRETSKKNKKIDILQTRYNIVYYCYTLIK